MINEDDDVKDEGENEVTKEIKSLKADMAQLNAKLTLLATCFIDKGLITTDSMVGRVDEAKKIA